MMTDLKNKTESRTVKSYFGVQFPGSSTYVCQVHKQYQPHSVNTEIKRMNICTANFKVPELAMSYYYCNCYSH